MLTIKKIFPFFAAALTAFLIYFPALNYGLTDLDDKNFIFTCSSAYEQKTIISDAFKNNVLFGRSPTPFYRPVLSLSFALDNRIAGTSVRFAHFTNIMLHVFSVIIALFFFRRYLSLGAVTSFLAAALFALHPVNIQTVAWIPGRNDSLYFIYFMLSFMFLIEYLRKGQKIWLAPHFLFLLVCFFTKESAISIPFLFLAYILIFRKENTKQLPVYVYGAWFGGIILFLYVRKSVLPDSTFSVSMLKGFNLENLSIFLDHISSAVFLQTPLAANLTLKVFILGFISLAILLFFISGVRKDKIRFKQSIFYLLFTFFFLLPDFVGDRLFFHGNRMYVPLFGMLAVVFIYINNLNITQKKNRFVLVLCMVYIVLSGAVTASESGTVRNSLAFWGKLIEESRQVNVVAHKFHVYALIDNNMLEQAKGEAAYIAQLINYADPEINYCLAYSLLLNQNYNQAANIYEHIVRTGHLKVMPVYAGLIISNIYLNNDEKAQYYFNEALTLFKAPAGEFNSYVGSYNRFLENKRRQAAE